LTELPEVDGFGLEVSVVLAAVLAAVLTVCVNAVEVLLAKPVSPRYAAVIACVPTAKLDVTKLAVPPTRFPEPSGVLPSRKLTVPVGTPVPETSFTCAWKVTD